MLFLIYIITGILTYFAGKWLAKHPTGVPDLPVAQNIEDVKEALFAFFLMVMFFWPLFWCVIAVSSATKFISVMSHKKTA